LELNNGPDIQEIKNNIYICDSVMRFTRKLEILLLAAVCIFVYRPVNIESTTFHL